MLRSGSGQEWGNSAGSLLHRHVLVWASLPPPPPDTHCETDRHKGIQMDTDPPRRYKVFHRTIAGLTIEANKLIHIQQEQLFV